MKLKQVNPKREMVWAVITCHRGNHNAVSWFETEAAAESAAQEMTSVWDSVYVVRAYSQGGLAFKGVP